MIPVEFDGVNMVYGKDQPEYVPLPVNQSQNGNLIACFQCSPAELEEIARTGKVWVSVSTFNQALQPLIISGHELEHNIPTGGVTYKNLPECKHESNERNFCKHCNLKLGMNHNPN